MEAEDFREPSGRVSDTFILELHKLVQKPETGLLSVYIYILDSYFRISDNVELEIIKISK